MNPAKTQKTIVDSSPTYIGSYARGCRAAGEKFSGSDASTDPSPAGVAGATITGGNDSPNVGEKWSTGPVPGPGVASHESE